jgi:hypothetical protein
MSSPAEAFKINLNQNLWGLVVTFSALGLAEQYHLCTLFWLAVISSSVMTLSVIVTTAVYTFKYCKDKLS